MTEFVPPRDKTPAFSVSNRPATGHLYKYAIYTGAVVSGVTA